MRSPARDRRSHDLEIVREKATFEPLWPPGLTLQEQIQEAVGKTRVLGHAKVVAGKKRDVGPSNRRLEAGGPLTRHPLIH